MFKWLLGRKDVPASNDENSTANFENAYQMLLARAAALKKEYDRTYTDRAVNIEIMRTLEQYKDPEYILGCRDFILASAKDPTYKPAHQVLPTLATMFMTMASETFPSDSAISSFSRWANTFPDIQKRELVRFAYIATVWEQEQSGPTSPISFATRVLLMTLAANANDDPASREVARDLFSYLDRLADGET